MDTKVQPGAVRAARTWEVKVIADDVEVKGDGSFACRFLSWGGPDLDGDYQVRGSIDNLNESVAVSAWGHSSWGTAPPVGRATLTDDARGAIGRGRFFGTQAGREHLEIVRSAGRAQPWSYRFKVHEREGPTIVRQSVFEISPVLRAAGLGTESISVDDVETRSALTSTERAALGDAKASFEAWRQRQAFDLAQLREIRDNLGRR